MILSIVAENQHSSGDILGRVPLTKVNRSEVVLLFDSPIGVGTFGSSGFHLLLIHGLLPRFPENRQCLEAESCTILAFFAKTILEWSLLQLVLSPQLLPSTVYFRLSQQFIASANHSSQSSAIKLRRLLPFTQKSITRITRTTRLLV